MAPLSYVKVASPFGDVGIVWREETGGPRVHHILLPAEPAVQEQNVAHRFPGARRGTCPPIRELGLQLQRFLDGEAVGFDLGVLALGTCSEFQRRVLLAEARIPRGRVSTYGRIAAHLGVPGGARAVGGALARNPFPLVIPCHRAVRSDGRLGGFQGGLEMKRALLALEGVTVTSDDRVAGEAFYAYPL